MDYIMEMKMDRLMGNKFGKRFDYNDLIKMIGKIDNFRANTELQRDTE